MRPDFHAERIAHAREVLERKLVRTEEMMRRQREEEKKSKAKSPSFLKRMITFLFQN